MKAQRGFTLLEMAIVLVIAGLLAGASMQPLNSALHRHQREQTSRLLVRVQEAVTGYWIAFAQLPCPVPVEGMFEQPRPVSGGHCDQRVGAVPARELGIAGSRDAQGRLVDSWGRPVLYAVGEAVSDEASGSLAANQSAENTRLPEFGSLLSVCRVASQNRCPDKDQLAGQVAWLVLSTAADVDSPGLQQSNRDGDTVFALQPYSRHPDNYFDDLMLWGSRSELVYWHVRSQSL